MSVPVFRKPTLKSERKNKTLMHICRNTIGTQSVLHSRFYSGLSVDACRKEVKSLCDSGFLVQYPLWDNKPFYRIGGRAVSMFGWPRRRSIRLGATRLPYEVGCYAYTNMGDVVRKRLLPHELQREMKKQWKTQALSTPFKPFPRELMHFWAYVWHDDVFSTIRVEPRCANPKRIVEKCREQLYRYCTYAVLERLHQKDRLRFVIVVASEHQEAALHQANDELGETLPLEAAHYDELVRFM